MKRYFVEIAVVAACSAATSTAFAQGAVKNFPTKPMRVVVPFASGSGADSNTRFYSELLGKRWGQSIVVDNRPGGSGIVAAMAVKNAAADGYTLLTATTSTTSVNPVVMKDLPYDPIRDFRPIVLFNLAPTVFLTRSNSPNKTIKDWVDATKKSGVPLAMGNYSAGYELITAWLSQVTGIAITPVPYKGAAAVITDVAGGQIPTGLTDFAGAVPLIKEGRLRALALTAEERHPILPELPTMRENGYADFVSYSYSSIFVRTETPDAIVNKLHEGYSAVMASPEGRAYQASRPAVVVNYTPKEIRTFVIAESERFRKIAQVAGIKPR